MGIRTELMTIYIGFEVLTTVVMKNSVFWDVTVRSPLNPTVVSEENAASVFRVEE
jgi:hypothetical protein